MSESDISRLIGSAVVLGVAALAYLGAVRLGQRFVKRLQAGGAETGARAATLWLMIRRVILAVLVITAILMVLSIWSISLTPFVAMGTVAGAAIGFGAQDLIKDLLAGFFILAEDQYHVGDTISIAGTTGTVEDIQFRVTVLRDYEGNVHFVPNGQITVTSNFTSVFAQPILDVGVAYAQDIDAAMEIILDELNLLAAEPEWRDRISEPAEMLGVQKLGDSSVVLRARLTTLAEERWSVRREALRRSKNRLDREGIEIPFPQVTVHQR